MNSTFRSLEIYNYRVWAAGAIVSNVGSWMQRIAQDWLVLTQLTNENAAAVGVVLALQFGPQVLLLPVTGFAADRLDRRKLLMATQASMGLLALGLGLLTVTGHVQLWQVYLFALLLGVVTAFDTPARQTFVADLVNESHLSNAVGLNSTSFQLGRFVGPAVAGLLIAAVGTGWVFIINAASFAAVLLSLTFLRVRELHVAERAVRARGSLMDGFRYVRQRPDLRVIMLMMLLVGTFGMNFPIFLSTMSVTVFDAGAGAFGLLTSAVALGSVTGALLSARRTRPQVAVLVMSATAFGGFLALAAVIPAYALFAVMLVLVGVASQTLTTSSNSTVQMTTDRAMRGRVMAIFVAVLLGGTPIGAPLVGWVADAFGPRWAVGVGAAGGLAAAAVGLYYLVTYQHLRIHRRGWRLRVAVDRLDVAESGFGSSGGVGQSPSRKRSYPAIMGARMAAVESHREAIHVIAARHRARSISVFGSVARGDDGPGSDIDFLVEFEPGASLLDLMRIQDDLEELLACRVDVVSAGGLKDRDEHIRREAVLV